MACSTQATTEFIRNLAASLDLFAHPSRKYGSAVREPMTGCFFILVAGRRPDGPPLRLWRISKMIWLALSAMSGFMVILSRNAHSAGTNSYKTRSKN
ncbi:MAG: hypothetical protein H7273_05725 [Polaromonas sp.]|nr:hypothetical protein [Polaromonas sp.]